MDKNEQVVLIITDWNDTDKYYQMPFERLIEFRNDIEKDGLDAAHKKMIQEVNYGDETGKPITFGKVDMRNDDYYLAWKYPKEALESWDEYLS